MNKLMSVAVAGASLMAFAAGTAARAQEPDRAARNREAVRRAFPIIGLFDRKASTPAAADASQGPTSSTPTSGTPTASGPGIAAGRHRSVTDFDVAGVRLGASPAEVRAAMARAGYRITSAGEAQSFEQDVAIEVARRRSQRIVVAKSAGTHNLIATGPHQESLIVEFMQAPGGSAASNIALSVPAEAMARGAFGAQLLAKYGTPDSSRANGSELSWCSPETMANCGRAYAPSGPLENQHPLLTATVDPYGGGGGLRLQVGETAFPALMAAKEAAVERLVPRTDRAAF